MPKYMIDLNTTIFERKRVIVEAEDEDKAQDVAWDRMCKEGSYELEEVRDVEGQYFDIEEIKDE